MKTVSQSPNIKDGESSHFQTENRVINHLMVFGVYILDFSIRFLCFLLFSSIEEIHHTSKTYMYLISLPEHLEDHQKIHS